ncbi:vacuolar fusion protein CCZ1 homolog [Tribolium madens]|uniref:vacuolar fusion protein CCZ1 homolog n=1 Tax=Tribolium madens TaxID=41895 RepID=UPI001CF760ED|nr:vacuolar fusion protein CCZ1 homolog [Tribolium madens]
MSMKKDVELKNFFIFNSLYGPKEGEELKKILYYYPITDNADVQIKNVGLVEGIIQFTGTFKPSTPVNSLHTQKMRQLYFQPEKNMWIVMTLTLPTEVKGKDSSNQIEYLEDDVQDNVYEAVLKQAYYTYRLFWDTFEHTVENHDVGTLKTRLENFYKAYLKTLKLGHADILNVFHGIQYLPLDKLTFLKVQCFINSLECEYPEIEYTAFLYNDHLIWSGFEPKDMKIVYQYLIGTLLPANMEAELQGGSMPRNSASPFAALHHGRFITGPTNLKTAKSVGKIPKVYLFASGKAESYNLVVYRALSASICLFMKADKELSLQYFKDMDGFISPKLTAVVSDISEYCSKQVITPSNVPENAPRFIYFNKLNLAYKSTAHLDNKQTGNIACTKESLKIMADLNNKKSLLGHSSETIVKTMNDYWVVAKNSNSREFYVALQQKNASLIDISEEIKKLCDTELKGIFFHPL